MPQAGFEPAQNPSSGFDDSSYAVLITTQSGQWFLKWKFKNNWATYQEHFNTFQEHKRHWKCHNNWFEGFFKKLNIIITKDKSHEIKYQQEQNYESLSIIK